LKQWLRKIVQFILFPALGISIVWWLFRDQELSDIISILANDTNYYWILLSVVFGVLSHMSRAARWQQLLEATGGKVGFNNAFWAVMTGYFINLLVPRMGEVSKCGVISKYENISFTKVIGTVVVERLFDLLMLVFIFVIVLTLQFELLSEFLSGNVDVDKMKDAFLSPVTYIVIFSIVLLVYIIRRNRHSIKLFREFSVLWMKFKDGFSSIRNIKNVPLFWFYTVFMWLMYFAMVYVCFFSFEATSQLGAVAGFTILLTGSLGMLVPVQGGLGTWHAMVIATLVLFGIDTEMAGVFALVVHGAQTLMIIITGLLAFVILPLTNSDKSVDESA